VYISVCTAALSICLTNSTVPPACRINDQLLHKFSGRTIPYTCRLGTGLVCSCKWSSCGWYENQKLWQSCSVPIPAHECNTDVHSQEFNAPPSVVFDFLAGPVFPLLLGAYEISKEKNYDVNFLGGYLAQPYTLSFSLPPGFCLASAFLTSLPPFLSFLPPAAK